MPRISFSFDDSLWVDPIRLGPVPYSEVLPRILGALEAHGRTRGALALATGSSHSFLRQMQRGDTEARISSLYRFVEAIRVLGVEVKVRIDVQHSDRRGGSGTRLPPVAQVLCEITLAPIEAATATLPPDRRVEASAAAGPAPNPQPT